MTRSFYTVVSVLVVLVISACAQNRHSVADPKKNPTVGTAVLVKTYRIGIDDVLQVTVWRNPDLSVSVPVRPDGKISVPLVGDMQAGGLTPEEVSKNIRQALSHYIRDPNVTIIMTSLNSHEFLNRIRVTGAVQGPRSLPYRQGMTVLDAILESGATNQFAAPNRTKVYRKVNNEMEVIDIKLGDILNKGKLQTNILLEPGDVVTVPERLF